MCDPTLAEVGVPTIVIVPPELRGFALPVTVLDPEALPDLVVVTVTIALDPNEIPLTVNGKLEPFGVPGRTVPLFVVAA
jgi:hypothetical protein